MSALKPDVDSKHDLGTTSLRWRNLFVDGITVTDNVTVAGNLTVEGATTTITTQDLVVKDPLIKLGDGNAGDVKDIGFFGQYTDGSAKYAGLFRDADDGKFRLFTASTENIGTATTIDITNAGYTEASLVVGRLEAVNSVDLTTDNSSIRFGADQDVLLTHSADKGLRLSLKEANYGAGSLLHGSALGSIVSYVNSSSAEDGDYIGGLWLNANNLNDERGEGVSAAYAELTYASILGRIKDPTTGTEDGALIFRTVIDGIETTVFDIGDTESGSAVSFSGRVLPKVRAGAQSQLGYPSKEWSDLYLADESRIFFGNDQDVKLTHVHEEGLQLNDNMQLQFRSGAEHVSSPAAGKIAMTSESGSASDALSLDALAGGFSIDGVKSSNVTVSPVVDADDLAIELAASSTTTSAGSFVVGTMYQIVSTTDGDGGAATDFTQHGSADSNVGTIFEASNAGSGTGTARELLDASIKMTSLGTGSDAIDIDAPVGSMLIGKQLADGQTLKLGKANAVEMTFAPHDTAANEKWSLVNTGGITEGSDSDGAIKLDAVAGGIALHWADDKNLWAEGGQAYITANENVADSIKLHADAGASQTITLLNDEGTGAAAIGLTASAGGITLTSASAVKIDSDSLDITSDQISNPLVKIINTANDSAGSRLRFVKDRVDAGNTAAGVALDFAGLVEFYSYNDRADESGGPEAVKFAEIKAQIADATDGEEGGKLSLNVASHNGTSTSGLVLTDGNLEGEVDVTIGAGTSSLTTVAGDLKVSGSSLRFAPDSDATIGALIGASDLTLGGSTSTVVVAGNLKVNGNDLDFADGSAANIGASVGAFNLTLGSSDSTVVVANDLTVNSDAIISGNLTVNGTTTSINSQTVSVDDKNIELGAVAEQTGVQATSDLVAGEATVSVSSTTGFLVGATVTKTAGDGAFGDSAKISEINSETQITLDVNHATSGSITFTVGGATDVTADGGGITLKGSTDKTFNWVSDTNSWTASKSDSDVIHMELAHVNADYRIDGAVVLSKTELASGVTTASGLNAIGSTSAGILAISSPDIKIYDASVNEANPSLSLGATDDERLLIQTHYTAGTKLLEQVQFTTKSASGDADIGKFVFAVDDVDMLTIDDAGLVLKNSSTIGSVEDDDLLTLGNEALTLKGALTVGDGTTGYDVTLVGSETGAYLKWSEVSDQLEVRGAAGSHGTLLLSTAELTVADGDKLGRIDFQAPLESDETDAIAVAASIWAEADVGEDGFTASVNDTDLVFATGSSEAATEKMRLDSVGNLSIAGDLIVTGNEIKSGNASSSTTAITLSDDDVTIADQLTIGGKTVFGATNIELTATADIGLTITNTKADTDARPVVLQLKSEEDAVELDDVIASLEFAAGDSDGSDAALVSAGIHAIAEENFGADANATKLVFTTAVSESAAASATAKMTLASTGNLSTAGSITATGSFIIGSADLNETDLEKLDEITDGIAAENKAVVLGGSKQIAGIGTVGCGAITSTGTSTFAGGITPATQDGAALGAQGTEWSDLHLANEATITFGNGVPTVTLTHETTGGLVLSAAGSSDKPDFTILNTNADATSAGLLLKKAGGDQGAGDAIGEIAFIGQDANDADNTYSRIASTSDSAAAGSVRGGLDFEVSQNGTLRKGMQIYSDIAGSGNVNIDLGFNSDSEVSVKGSLSVAGSTSLNGDFITTKGRKYATITHATATELELSTIHHTIIVTNGSATITIPDAVDFGAGREFILIATASGVVVTPDPGDAVYDNLHASANSNLVSNGSFTMTQNVAYRLLTDGNNWYRI